jgi:XTP/dITP diphosphohydrolase
MAADPRPPLRKVLVATRSLHKLKEIRALLRDVEGIEWVSLDQIGIRPSDEEEGIEAFDTFEANALAKARWFRDASGLPTLADDSGIEVDALHGRPGVHSRRFAPGHETRPSNEQDEANNLYLLELLGDLDLARRTARYVCVAALALPNGDEFSVRGEAEGLILGRPRGWGGFGYDPLFFDPPSGRTFAEITPEEKDARSHRGHAFRLLRDELIRGRTL